jgi:hypothetical protein
MILSFLNFIFQFSLSPASGGNFFLSLSIYYIHLPFSIINYLIISAGCRPFRALGLGRRSGRRALPYAGLCCPFRALPPSLRAFGATARVRPYGFVHPSTRPPVHLSTRPLVHQFSMYSVLTTLYLFFHFQLSIINYQLSIIS